MTKHRRGGLGRGLGALIPTSSAPGGVGPTDIFFGAPDGSSRGGAGAEADGATAAGTTAHATANGNSPAPVEFDPVAPAANPGPESSAPAGVGLTPVPGAQLRELLVTQIRANPRQPRTVFDDDALQELTHSVRAFGVLQPIVVRQVDADGDGTYELVMGERRLRAAAAAGLETVPAIVRDTGDDAMLRDALLENIHRAQLNPLEEAAAYQQLLEEFGVTHDELAVRIGRSRPVITNMIRLMKLPIAVQRRVAAGVLSAGHARAVLALEGGADKQEELAARIIAEGLSVRATEEAVTLANRDGISDTSPTPRRKPIQMPGLQDVAESLSSAFDTRVTVSLGKRKGKIVVEFGSVDDLQRIVDLMNSSKA